MKPKPKNYLAGFDPDTQIVVANPNCSKCYGRGDIGFNRTTGFKQPCSCLRLKAKPIASTESCGSDHAPEPVEDAVADTPLCHTNSI